MSRFAALAVAHPTANAVGPLALTFGPKGLVVELAGVRPHVRGFALGGESQHATLVVPYSALRGLVREGHLLLLSFDPKVLFPYNRFALARVQRELDGDLARVRRRSAWVSLTGWLITLALAGVAWRLGLRGGFGATWPASLAAVAAALFFRSTRSRILRGGVASARLSRELERMLGERLGLVPSDVEILEAQGSFEPALASLGAPRWLLPAVLVGVVGVVGASVLLKRYGVVGAVRLPVPEARAGLVLDVPRVLDGAHTDVRPRRADCRCVRADSPLWSEAPTGVAILVTPLRGELDSLALHPESVYPVTHRGKDTIDLEVIVVNGTRMALPEIALVFTFWRRDGNDRKNIEERGLSWPRALEPGGSVRWRVRSRGDALKVTSYLAKAVEDAPFADADTFAGLVSNKAHASVRLHAATMLAYLGDPRAEAAARSLGVLSPLEERRRSALLETFPPFIACDVSASGACVMNRSDALVRRVTLHERAGHHVVIDDLFFPKRGVRVETPGFAAPLRVEPDYDARGGRAR